MEVDRQCIKCKQVFTVNCLNIKQRLCYTDDTKGIQITFCECDHCGEVNVLQLDDERTMQDLRKLTTLIARRAKNRGTYKRNATEDKETADRINKRMEERRKDLWKKYEGKSFYVRGGKILIKSLTPYA